MISRGVLYAHHLRKCFGSRVVVDDVSLEVRSGEVVGLLGPNGAGKTTIFQMITGVTLPDRGTVRLGEQELGARSLAARARLGLGYLPQHDTLFSDLNVLDNVGIAVQISGSGASATALLESVGLADLGSRDVARLSGGERKRLAIARLLAIRPRVLLLDEPFAGVDPIAIASLQALMRAIAQQGVAVLITDHAVRETLGVCDRAIVMDAGVVQAQGTPSEVAADPHARARYLGPDFLR